jgi:hypothetical protein
MLNETEIIPDQLFPQQLKKDGTTHPRFRAMAVSKADIEQIAVGEFWRVSYLYEGFLTTIPEPTYELSGGLNEEPIQLHKDFVSDLAGTAQTPKNGAIFLDPETGKVTTDNSKGVFREFGSGGLMGVDSFLDPGAFWTVTSYSLTRPSSLRSLGRINAPDGPNPSLSGRNWIVWEQSYRRRGHIYESRITWRLSGRGGWNSQIY